MGNELLPSEKILPYVDSEKSIGVRRWATQILKEYITKGFVLNDERMKNGGPFSQDYFRELQERIQEIRISERRAYQKIADIFEQCRFDYDKNSEITKTYYAVVWKNLLSKSDKMEGHYNQAIYSQMVEYAESAAENGELLCMKDWLGILNDCVDTEKG